MRTFTKSALAFASAGIVMVSLAGCSEPSSSSPTSTSAPSSAAPASSAPATPTPLAQGTLSGVHTQVTLDAGFVKALGELKLTPGVVGTAKLSKAGVLTFPITGGNIKYFDPTQKYRPYVQGVVDHDGSGISLTSGSTKVELTNFVIHPGSNSDLTGDVSLNGKSVVKGADIFTLDGSTLMPLTKDSAGDAVLAGTEVIVSPTAAGLLNKVFKTTAVTDKLLVGIAKITAKVG